VQSRAKNQTGPKAEHSAPLSRLPKTGGGFSRPRQPRSLLRARMAHGLGTPYRSPFRPLDRPPCAPRPPSASPPTPLAVSPQCFLLPPPTYPTGPLRAPAYPSPLAFGAPPYRLDGLRVGIDHLYPHRAPAPALHGTPARPKGLTGRLPHWPKGRDAPDWVAGSKFTPYLFSS